MEKEANSVPVDGTDTSSAVEDNASNLSPNDDVITMKKSTYEKLLREKKNVSAENTQLKSKIQLENEEKLKEQQQWQSIAEMREKELNEEKEKNALFQKKEKDAIKFAALKTELKGMGMDENFLDSDLVRSQIEKVQIDSETKLCAGADLIAKEIKQHYSPLFGNNVAGIDSSSPDAGHSSLSYDEWLKLPLSDQKKRMHEVIR